MLVIILLLFLTIKGLHAQFLQDEIAHKIDIRSLLKEAVKRMMAAA